MEKMQARMILEILGRPPEYLLESLNGLIDKLSKEKSVRILEKTVHDPLPAEDSKDLYSSFAEILIEIDSLEAYLGIIFAYMPSNIEIISPETINIKNDYLTEVGNKLLGRLHEYDALVKKSLAERDAFVMKLKEVAPHLFEKTGESANQEPKKEKKKSKK